MAQEFSVAGVPRYDTSSSSRWIVSHVLRYPHLPVIFLISTIGIALLYSYTSVLVGQAFDAIVSGAGLAQLTAVALTILGVRLLHGLIDVGNSFSSQYLAQLVERDAREELYVNLLGKSLTFHNQQRVGDIMARATNDVQQLNPMLTPGLSLIVESVLNIIIPLVLIATIKIELLVMPLLFLVTFVLALRNYAGALGPVAGALRGQFGQLNASLAESISGIEVVKGYAQEPAEIAKFSSGARAYRDLFVREGGIQARYLPLLLYGVLLGLGFGHALYLYTLGQISIGQIIAYMGLLEVLRFPTFISLFTFALLQLGFAGADRILSMMRTETLLDQNTAGRSATIDGAITFENVSFSYPPKPAEPVGPWGPPTPATPQATFDVLSKISFQASPGETIAIVGQTGAGKTTLTRLVNRVYDATAGRVLIDGVDVREWNLDSLRSQISQIEQDIFLFSRSIADNIAFGIPDASQERIERAAREAQAHEFISALPDGYATVVGERGVTLSGGQRQRIAIARAFLSNPRILILDDSTSAIDSATEDEIQKAMRLIMQGRTTLLITHRLSQIRWADRVLVLRGGELVAQGTHDELMQTSDVYRKIFARYG